MKLNKRYKIVLISLIIVVVLIGSYFVTKSLFVRTKAEVSYVIDGDTIVLKNKQRVRLIGMNAPEIGDFYANDAKKYLCGLVCNKTIILESDKIDRDQYGRLLRYVWIGDELVNEEMLRAGLAFTDFDEDNRKYWDRMTKAEVNAMNDKKGLWKSNFGCLTIHEFNYNAEGDDCKNPNDEYIIFRNFCLHPINLGGYSIRDKDGNLYRFPNITLETDQYITLHSGSGNDNSTDIFWNSNKKCPAVWNNDHDRMFIRDKDGLLVLFYEY